MKKNYIAPMLLCVKVNSSKMLALSQSITSVTTEDSGGELGARSNNGWDIWGDNDDKWENE